MSADDAQIEALVDERLVRREERGGVLRLELTHDVLTDVVRAGRDQRRERLGREQAERERAQAQRETQEARQSLRRSRALAIAMTALALVAGGLLVLTVDAYYWAKNNFLPPDSMLMLQRFRMGDAPTPEMVWIPAGKFDMGEQDKDLVKSGPQQYLGIPGKTGVEVAPAFTLGKYEGTYNQFDYYVWSHAAGVGFASTAKGGRGNQPVVNVSRKEADDYAKWFGERTHQRCRLPTEAEWEYAARAETRTAYWWGDAIGKKIANCKDCDSDWRGMQSAPVGRFGYNKFRLYDTSGNVGIISCESSWSRAA